MKAKQRAMIIKQFFLTFCFLGLPILPNQATAGHEVGNGGGAWVCREFSSQEIRWAHLADLFEAQVQSPIRDFNNSSEEEIIVFVKERLNELSPWLLKAFQHRYLKVQNFWTPVTSMQLEVMDDALYYGKPAPEWCSMGQLNYEQVAHFYPDGRIFIDKRIFDHFNVYQQTALKVHEAVKPIFEDVGLTQSNLTPAKYNGRWGYLNNLGQWVVANRFKSASEFSEGKAAVQNSLGKWSFINDRGQSLSAAMFEDSKSFSNGVAFVKQNALWGIINSDFHWIQPPTWNQVSPMKHGISFVKKDNNWNMISYHGTIIKSLSLNYEDVKILTREIIATQNEGVWVLRDFDEKQLTLDAYKNISVVKNDFFLAQLDQKTWAQLDPNFNVVWNIIADKVMISNFATLVCHLHSCYIDSTSGLRSYLPLGTKDATLQSDGTLTFLYNSRWGI